MVRFIFVLISAYQAIAQYNEYGHFDIYNYDYSDQESQLTLSPPAPSNQPTTSDVTQIPKTKKNAVTISRKAIPSAVPSAVPSVVPSAVPSVVPSAFPKLLPASATFFLNNGTDLLLGGFL